MYFFLILTRKKGQHISEQDIMTIKLIKKQCKKPNHILNAAFFGM